MRISFDIDDTLIFYDKSKNKSTNDKLLSGEILREGTIELLKEMQQNHELWIYTTSLRSPFFLKLFFKLKGIKIERVINQKVHQELLKDLKMKSSPTKLPNRYEIDLHIDDSEGVVMEGEKYRFNVLRIDPHDLDWTTKIKQQINAK